MEHRSAAGTEFSPLATARSLSSNVYRTQGIHRMGTQGVSARVDFCEAKTRLKTLFPDSPCLSSTLLPSSLPLHRYPALSTEACCFDRRTLNENVSIHRSKGKGRWRYPRTEGNQLIPRGFPSSRFQLSPMEIPFPLVSSIEISSLRNTNSRFFARVHTFGSADSSKRREQTD